MQSSLLLSMLAASASAFSAGHVRLPAASRCVTPSMQFGKKKDAPPKAGAKGKAGGKSGGFYDDEIDTVSKPAWRFDANDNIAENGEVDLANVGGVRSFPPSLPACFGGYACRLSPQTACQLSHQLSHPLTGVYYLAAVPFLLFFLAYAFGAFDFGYGRGNF